MTIASWYLTVGLAVCAIGYLLLHGSGTSASDVLRRFRNPFYPEDETLWYRFRLYVLLPLICVILVIAVWPAAIALYVWNWIKRRGDREVLAKPKVFSLERSNLVEQIPMSEIERRETVFDPYNAAPNVPFGHLNPAWSSFVGGLADADVLWSFSATWRNDWGQEELRSGYVAVRSGVPGPYFLTERRVVES